MEKHGAGIIEYATGARQDDGRTRHLVLGVVESAGRIEDSAGVDLNGYCVILDAAKIKHIFDSHGDGAKEARQGQRAVAEDDIALIPDIVNHFDTVLKSPKKTNGELEALVFVKKIGTEAYYYTAEIRKGKKHLAPATLYIKI